MTLNVGTAEVQVPPTRDELLEEVQLLRRALASASESRLSVRVYSEAELVPVSWTACDCEYETKLCREEHTRYALVPRPLLEQLAS